MILNEVIIYNTDAQQMCNGKMAGLPEYDQYIFSG